MCFVFSSLTVSLGLTTAMEGEKGLAFIFNRWLEKRRPSAGAAVTHARCRNFNLNQTKPSTPLGKAQKNNSYINEKDNPTPLSECLGRESNQRLSW